jgi:hypothetical protein
MTELTDGTQFRFFTNDLIYGRPKAILTQHKPLFCVLLSSLSLLKSCRVFQIKVADLNYAPGTVSCHVHRFLKVGCM